MSESFVQKIADLYKERTRNKKIITPYTVFLSENGSSIYIEVKTNMGSKFKSSEVRKEFRKKWDQLSLLEKKYYEEKAVSKGYVKPTLNIQQRKKYLGDKMSKLK